MRTNSNTEEILKERIKELTCLYEVTNHIVNTEPNRVNEAIKAIAFSLKKAFQIPSITHIRIEIPDLVVQTSETIIKEEFSQINSTIQVFNVPKGKIIAYQIEKIENKDLFLHEELLLIDNVAIKIGSLLERLEIKNNELSMRRQIERADRLSILGELTAGIAHELNTPLANILGFAELLKVEIEPTDNRSLDVDKIIQNAIFSREVVKKLMFFACEMPQEMQLMNIVPSIKNAIDLLHATFRKYEVKYLVKIKEEELWLRADHLQLTQIIFNLVINAIYFSPKNGLVIIEAFELDNKIIIRITDEGPGLSNLALEKIFQPFFSTKPIGEGSGLGLSVVHGIVSSHKGKITVKNGSHKGAIFEVSLPK